MDDKNKQELTVFLRQLINKECSDAWIEAMERLEQKEMSELDVQYTEDLNKYILNVIDSLEADLFWMINLIKTSENLEYTDIQVKSDNLEKVIPIPWESDINEDFKY